MKNLTQYLANILLVLILIFVSCSPATKIVGSWKNPQLGEKKYSDIYIFAMTDNFINRKTFEEDVAIVLKEKGLESQTSVYSLAPGIKLQDVKSDDIVNAMEKSKNDGLLTMGVIDQTSETRYVQGSAYPMAGFGFRGYYGAFGTMAYSPGYYTTDKSYFIEIKLFDVKTGDMVWSAQSETTNPGKIETAAMEFARVVVDRMINDGVLNTPPKK
jgi:PBP1b-binding outer membrane lipoprotein LpoB